MNFRSVESEMVSGQASGDQSIFRAQTINTKVFKKQTIAITNWMLKGIFQFI